MISRILRIILSNSLVFVSFCGIVFSQPITEKGYYLSISNFTPKEYKARPQNWSIVEDKRGVLFFGNNHGVLEYDGTYWNLINANHQIVRSLAVDSSGIVYVGGVNDFGYLKPGPLGELNYQSLLPASDSLEYEFEDVWNTHGTSEGVFFQAMYTLFFWNYDTLIKWNTETVFDESFWIMDRLYIREAGKGLLVLQDDSLVLVPGGEKFRDQSVEAMIPYQESDILVFTEDQGLYHLETGRDQEITRLIRHFNEIDNFLFEGSISCAVRVSRNQFAIGSEGNGVIVYNQMNDQFDFINYTSGLQDEVVYDVMLDSRGNLWMALHNGISMSPASSSVTTFGYNSGIKETVEGITRYNRKLFIASFMGIHYLDVYQTSDDIPDIIYNHMYSRPGFRDTETTEEECFGVSKFNSHEEDLLLYAGYSGVYHMAKDFRSELVLECIPWAMHQSKTYPERVVIANSYGIETVYRKNNKWIHEDPPEMTEGDCRVIVEDKEGSIWVGASRPGAIYKLDFSKPGLGSAPTVIEYYTGDMLPEGDICLAMYGDSLLAGTSEGLYIYHPASDEFRPEKRFGAEFGDGTRGIHRISVDHEGLIWLVTYFNKDQQYETGYFQQSGNGSFTWVKEPFLGFSKGQIHNIFHDPDGVTWLGGPDGLFRYDRNIELDYELDYNVLIRKILISGDSMIFAGTFTDEGGRPISHQDPDKAPVIRYRYNDITFEFSAPNNQDGTPVLFSHYLEGFDEDWHDWSTENRREYTNLPERTYTFHLRARNLYDHESEGTSYTFIIKPPWYRTFPAIAGFLILGIAVVWLIIVLYTRGLRAIIRERTAEIRQQKDVIEEKNKDIMASISYAQRIQEALLPPGDYIDGLFPERFIFYRPRDIVSGDYYWMIGKNGRIICVTADCTGHGVPGAMMSMMGMSFLNEITSKDDHLHSEEILNMLRSQIVTSLRQRGVQGESQDGMDMALYIIDREKMELEFSGANLPLYLFRNKELKIIEYDRMPIGISSKLKTPFTRHTIPLQPGDMLYTFTDGYQDQFGGPRNKKFMIKRFRQLMCDIHDKSLNQQKKFLQKTLEEWMQESSSIQVDDITVIGVKI